MGISLEDFSDPVAIKLLVILALFAMLAHTCAQDFFKKYIVSSLNLRPPGLTLKPGWRGWFTGWESACGRPHSERVAERSFGITSRDVFSTPFSSSPHLNSIEEEAASSPYLTHNTSPYTPNDKKAKWVRRREPLKDRVVEYRAQQCKIRERYRTYTARRTW